MLQTDDIPSGSVRFGDTLCMFVSTCVLISFGEKLMKQVFLGYTHVGG